MQKAAVLHVVSRKLSVLLLKENSEIFLARGYSVSKTGKITVLMFLLCSSPVSFFKASLAEMNFIKVYMYMILVLLLSQDIALANNVSAMPTFKFFKGKVKVDEMTGADEKKLEEKIKKWIGDESNDVGVKGHVSAVYSCLVLLIDPS